MFWTYNHWGYQIKTFLCFDHEVYMYVDPFAHNAKDLRSINIMEDVHDQGKDFANSYTIFIVAISLPWIV